MRNLKFVMFVMLLMILTPASLAQTRTSVQCGDIIEGEFTQDEQPQLYSIDLSAGDSLNTRAVPLGATLQMTMGLFAPNDALVWYAAEGIYDKPISLPEMNTDILSANGTYTIVIYNNALSPHQILGDGYKSSFPGGVGVYTLFIGCTLRDGTVIRPGESPVEDPVPDPGNATISPPAIVPAFGFPGLAPVDFSNGVTIPLQPDVPNSGSISTGFDGIFGYKFNMEDGQNITLDFNRTGGNLNLGIVLLSADNQVVFQSSLTTSTRLSTDLIIPATSEYMVGVYRLDMIPPDAPADTTFTLSIVSN